MDGEDIQCEAGAQNIRWATLHDGHYERIHRHLQVRARSEFLADDLTQETLMNAVRYWDGFQGRGKLENWLLAIANNVFNRYLEKEARFQQSAFSRAMRVIADRGGGEDRDGSLHEALEDLSEEVMALPKSLREPLELTALREMGYDEAARQLGIEVNTLRMRVHRAKKILARRLAKHKSLFYD